MAAAPDGCRRRRFGGGRAGDDDGMPSADPVPPVPRPEPPKPPFDPDLPGPLPAAARAARPLMCVAWGIERLRRDAAR